MAQFGLKPLQQFAAMGEKFFELRAIRAPDFNLKRCQRRLQSLVKDFLFFTGELNLDHIPSSF